MRHPRNDRASIRGWLPVLVTMLFVAAPVLAQSDDVIPPWVDEPDPVNPRLPVDPSFERAANAATVDLTRIGDSVPMDLEFVDETGKRVRLGDYFDGERPVVLAMIYFRCPMLCGLVGTGLKNALVNLEWTAGTEFQVLNVSIDPEDTPETAAGRKANFLTSYDREPAEEGFRILTGDEDQIRALADAIGFGYYFDPEAGEEGEYAHPPGLFLFTPEGRLARVLPNIDYQGSIRKALIEAGDGKIGDTRENIFFQLCWQWDPNTGEYVNVAWKVMRTGGVLMILAMAGLIFYMTRRMKPKWEKDLEAEELQSREFQAGAQS